MKKNEILEEINLIFQEVLDDQNIMIDYDSNSDNVDDWDSLAHIQLIVAIEKKFKVRFTAKEMVEWKNVGEMIESILKKLSSN